MTLFSAAELADLRAEQSAAMPFSCVVSNPVAEVSDGAGGGTAGTPATATVACRVGSPNATDQKVADRLSVVVDSVLTVPYGTTVSGGATISCSDNSKDYDVVHVNTEQTYQTAVRALCRSIRSET